MGVVERATYLSPYQLFRPKFEVLWSLHNLFTELVRRALSALRVIPCVSWTQVADELYNRDSNLNCTLNYLQIFGQKFKLRRNVFLEAVPKVVCHVVVVQCNKLLWLSCLFKNFLVSFDRSS